MEIVGRIIGNAEIKKLKDEREFVIFSIAVNDFYKQKGTDKECNPPFLLIVRIG